MTCTKSFPTSWYKSLLAVMQVLVPRFSRIHTIHRQVVKLQKRRKKSVRVAKIREQVAVPDRHHMVSW